MNTIASRDTEAGAGWTDTAMDKLRADVREIVAKEGLKQTEVAKQCGAAYSTFAAWFAGAYAGDNTKVANEVQKWVETRTVKAVMAASLPEIPTYQDTPTGKDILKLLEYCQHMPDLGVVAGGAGIGKTTTCEEYQRRAPNVFMITAEPVMRSPRNFLGELARVLGLGEGSSLRQSTAIAAKLRGTNALIIVDEAQHLSTSTLNQARAIHDRARCGMVFVGNETVYSRMGDGRAEFAQIFSRVGMKMTRQKPRNEDADTLVAAWGLTGIDLKLPRAIAKKPGALRGLTKTIRLAHVMAAGDGAAVSDKHIKAAFEQLGFDRVDGV